MPSFVYVFGAVHQPLVKIGTTVDVGRRLRELQTGSPVPLQTLWTMQGDQSMESRLHADLRRFRVRGEWFDFGQRDPVEAVVTASVRLGLLGWPAARILGVTSTPIISPAKAPAPERTVRPVQPAQERTTYLSLISTYLDQQAEPVPFRQIVDAVGVKAPTMSMSLARLARAGRVVRVDYGVWASRPAIGAELLTAED